MPKGPQGQWRPAGSGALAVYVCRIATGEIEEIYKPPPNLDDHGRASRQASVAGKARASALRPERRRAIACAAAVARWGDNE